MILRISTNISAITKKKKVFWFGTSKIRKLSVLDWTVWILFRVTVSSGVCVLFLGIKMQAGGFNTCKFRSPPRIQMGAGCLRVCLCAYVSRVYFSVDFCITYVSSCTTVGRRLPYEIQSWPFLYGDYHRNGVVSKRAVKETGTFVFILIRTV